MLRNCRNIKFLKDGIRAANFNSTFYQRKYFASTIVDPKVTTDDIKLRGDVKLLGSLLGTSIKEHGIDIYESVEKLRLLGRKWRQEEDSDKYFLEMVNDVKKYDADLILGVSRAFTHFLALANAAEAHHENRRIRNEMVSNNEESAFPMHPDTCAGVIKKLREVNKMSPKEIMDILSSQKTEIVLTAHPTEVNRRTLLRKYQRIQTILTQTDRQDLLIFEKKQLERALREEISSIWESDELRRTKPTPVDEATTGFAIVEQVLWHALPQFLRKLDDVTKQQLGMALPLTVSPIKLASWMGGDRDGNPNVTPEITLEVSLRSRWWAATLFKNDISKLRSQLSIIEASPELRDVVGKDVREPYRYVLHGLENRLSDTIAWLDSKIFPDAPSVSVTPMTTTSELMEPLLLLHRSLVETTNFSMADGLLVDTIRRLATFGLCLMPLDIRQESTRHTEALDAVTRWLGVGSYSQWDEVTRRNWLQTELASKRPLLPRGKPLSSFDFSPTVVDTLSTFELAASLIPGSLGAYVISQCQQASDVLAVMLLQQDAGVPQMLRVVPLFETLDDLQRAPSTVDALFSLPGYRGRIGGHQEIMVGYSDSAKDAGRLAASWAQYIAQDTIMKVGKKHHVDITFFHGKGGTVGRGGNPDRFRAILAHPPNTINGSFRITEQGEMITQNFGEMTVAERSFDVFTAGVLAERFEPRPEPKQEWVDMMNALSESSCEAYRNVVRHDDRFVPYFRTSTPEQELSGLNVGSRPAKRNPKGGVESLRAIPWVFAWTQTRLNLPTWLGVGESFSAEMKENSTLLREMYKDWPWFQTLVDLIEMILVKSDKRVAANYDNQLVKDASSKELGRLLRERLDMTAEAVLAVSLHPKLQHENVALLRSLSVRNPYIDPLNVLQAELLRRLRSDEPISDANKQKLKDALLVTINGIANGMRNSG